MAFTRDWSNAIPIDHSKFKDQPGAVRDLRVDLEDRLSEILYGFTAGETKKGIKLGRFHTIGTGSPAAADTDTVVINARTYNGKVELFSIDDAGNELRLGARGNHLPNDYWFKALNYAGSASVNLLKIDTGNKVQLSTQMLDAIWPIGSVYISVINTSPATLFGGTWVAFGAGKTLVGLDSGDADFDTAEETGGEKTHTLTTAEMPAHQHNLNLHSGGGTPFIGAYGSPTITNQGSCNVDSAGGGGAHNNLPPYIVVYMWKRTA